LLEVVEANLHANDGTSDREPVTSEAAVTETVDVSNSSNSNSNATDTAATVTADGNECIASAAAAAAECKLPVTHQMHALALNNLGEVSHAQCMDTVATAYFERALDVLHSAK
jgi:phage tail protein X